MASNTPFHIVFAGGGTGGHLIPGLVIASRFRERFPDSHVTFLSTGRDIEQHILGTQSFPVIPIQAPRLPGILGAPGFAVKFPLAVIQSYRMLRNHRPHLVFGLGGYGSVPPAIAGMVRNVPLAVLEINTHMGKANRRLSKKAERIFLQFEESLMDIPAGIRSRGIVTGCPIRPSLRKPTRAEAANFFSLDPRRRTLLVIGGSQGAQALNDILLQTVSLPAYPKVLNTLQILHICGPANLQSVSAHYAALQKAPKVLDYCDRMDMAYAIADVVLSRAGAGTIAELLALNKPALLMPLPTAAEDHQTRNARYIVQRGLGKILPERTTGPEGMMAALEDSFIKLRDTVPSQPPVVYRQPEDWIIDEILGIIKT